MANPFIESFGKLIWGAFACPKCGKSTLVVGMGTIREETVTPATHCTCPGGPVDRKRKMEESNG